MLNQLVVAVDQAPAAANLVLAVQNQVMDLVRDLLVDQVLLVNPQQTQVVIQVVQRVVKDLNLVIFRIVILQTQIQRILLHLQVVVDHKDLVAVLILQLIKVETTDPSTSSNTNDNKNTNTQTYNSGSNRHSFWPFFGGGYFYRPFYFGSPASSLINTLVLAGVFVLAIILIKKYLNNKRK